MTPMNAAPTTPSRPRYSLGEEIANAVSHGVGLALAIAGLVLLTVLTARAGGSRHVVAVSIYGTCLTFMYSASTLYHAIPQPRFKRVLRQLDHASIFLLIAGTYTPFMLVNLNGPWGWTLCAVIWTLAAAGLVLQPILGKRRGLAVALYIAMGWVALVAIKPLLEAVAPSGIALLVAGGVAYTLGTFFYRCKRLPYSHAVWHGFVLLGSALHFFAVLFYVAPA